MPSVPTSNNGSTFYNINDCKSFRQTVTAGSLVALSAYPCSEVLIVNRTGGNILVFDNNNFSVQNSFLMKNDEQYTFRGLTSTSVVSTSGAATGDIYYRSQYYSLLPQR